MIKRTILSIIFLFALAAISRAQSTCTISGTLKDISGVPVVGKTLRITPLSVPGVVVLPDPIRATSTTGGAISFIAIRGATVNIQGPVLGWNAAAGRNVEIPDEATATLESLLTTSTVPVPGVLLYEESTKLANAYGTLKFIGSTVTVARQSNGVATVTINPGAVDWSAIVNKPATFPPADHAASHASAGSDALNLAISQTTGLQTALDTKLTQAQADALYAVLAHNHSGVYQPASARLTEVAAIGTSLQQIRVNAAGNALEYFTYSGGSVWGSITGTLSDQTDLQSALDASLTQAEADALYSVLAHNHDGAYSAIGHNHAGVYEPANANIQSHIGSTSNPHSVTFAQLGSPPTTLAGYGITDAADLGANDFSGAQIVTSNAAAALAVGPNGDTNPVMRVVANVASQATGLSITGNASGSGVTLTVLGGTNESITLTPKGTGDVAISNGGLILGNTLSSTANFIHVQNQTGNVEAMIKSVASGQFAGWTIGGNVASLYLYSYGSSASGNFLGSALASNATVQADNTMKIGTFTSHALKFGTNDVERIDIAAATGVLTHTAKDSGTSAILNTIITGHESSGTPAAGFGTGLLFQGESSTTSNRDIAQVAGIFTVATDASRTSDLVFYTVNNAAALAEAGRFTGAKDFNIIGGLLTADPTSGVGPLWKLGALKTGTLVLDTANYIEVSVAGVIYKLALIQ